MTIKQRKARSQATKAAWARKRELLAQGTPASKSGNGLPPVTERLPTTEKAPKTTKKQPPSIAKTFDAMVYLFEEHLDESLTPTEIAQLSNLIERIVRNHPK